MNIQYIDADIAEVRNTGVIKLHSQRGFEGMRKAGALTASCLDALDEMIKPGITTQQIDDFVYEFGAERGGIPATLNYRGFTKSCCTSINQVVCHGIPNDKPLREGEIVNVDVTYVLDGWHGDSSRMYKVGEINRKAERLIDITYQSLIIGLKAIKPGNHTGDIGHAIQQFAEEQRCSVVRDFCGHGLGELFHDVPNILHYGTKGHGPQLKAGMIFTVEPMINLGTPNVKIKPDGWTAITRDRQLSAQFEHSIGVTENGCEVFTLSAKEKETMSAVWDNS